MINIDYSDVYDSVRFDKLNIDSILDLLENSGKAYAIEELQNAHVTLTQVQSPFIIADNQFDLREANNYVIELNVRKIKTVSFTGGNYYTEYEKKAGNMDINTGLNLSYVIQGNGEEGFNIFQLI